MEKKRSIHGVIFSIFSSSCFGLAAVFGKIAYEKGFSSLALTLIRTLICIIILFCIISIKNIKLKINRNCIKDVIILGFFGQAITTILLNTAYYFILPGTALILHFIYPAIVMLVMIIKFNEKPNIRKIFILVVIIGGVVFFFEGVSGNGLMGVVLALLSGLTWAFYIVFFNHSKVRKVNIYVLTFYQMIILEISCLILNLFLQDDLIEKSLVSYWPIIISGILFMFAVVFLQWGISRLGSANAAILGAFEPVSGLLFGFLILGESVSKNQLCGSAIIIIAVSTLVVLSVKTKQK